MKTRRQKGFTLYELLMTVVIVAILMSIGIPSFRAFTRNSEMAASVNDLLGSFQVARSEAARAKQNVSICASSDSLTATPSCTGEFEDGWIVFVDTDGDVEVDTGEVVLRAHPAMPDRISVTNTGQDDYFSYGPNGQGRGQVGTLQPPTTSAVFCDDRGNVPTSANTSAARVLRVLPIGRATVLRTVAQVTAQGGCP